MATSEQFNGKRKRRIFDRSNIVCFSEYPATGIFLFCDFFIKSIKRGGQTHKSSIRNYYGNICLSEGQGLTNTFEMNLCRVLSKNENKVSFKHAGSVFCLVVRNLSERKVSERILVSNEDELQKRPLVVILGWSDCKMKTLKSPYSALMERKNCTTICVTTSLWDNTMRYNTECRSQAIDVKNEMIHQLAKNKNRPVIFYNFCGGLFLYSHIMTGMDSNTFPGRNVCGTILDSCPFFPGFDTIPAFKTAFTSSRSNNTLNRLLGKILEFYGYIVYATSSTEHDFRHAVENVEVTSPQLFLFSKKDQITSHKRVNDFMKLRERKGVNVSHKLWDESKHVMHVKHHKKEYENLVYSFFENCLKNYYELRCFNQQKI